MTDYWRGHAIRQVGSGDWIYSDGTRVSDDPHRACGHCGLANSPEGHDGCLGTLPWTASACCGHGRGDAWAVLINGERVSAFDGEALKEDVRFRRDLRWARLLFRLRGV